MEKFNNYVIFVCFVLLSCFNSTALADNIANQFYAIVFSDEMTGIEEISSGYDLLCDYTHSDVDDDVSRLGVARQWLLTNRRWLIAEGISDGKVLSAISYSRDVVVFDSMRRNANGRVMIVTSVSMTISSEKRECVVMLPIDDDGKVFLPGITVNGRFLIDIGLEKNKK